VRLLANLFGGASVAAAATICWRNAVDCFWPFAFILIILIWIYLS
jgi:hypothetical protein